MTSADEFTEQREAPSTCSEVGDDGGTYAARSSEISALRHPTIDIPRDRGSYYEPFDGDTQLHRFWEQTPPVLPS